MVIERIKHRLAGEEGFTMIELLMVILILGILTVISVPSYLNFRVKAQAAAAQANVRSAIPAAESYYQGTGSNSYTGLTGATLRTEAPGIASTVKALSLNSGKGYCIEDTEGINIYSYAGGDTTAGVTYPSGKLAATVQTGSCATDTGVSGAA